MARIVVNSNGGFGIGTGAADQISTAYDNTVLSGGGGNDTYFINGTNTTILEGPGNGTDTVEFHRFFESFTLGDNVENLSLHGPNNTGFGNELNNLMRADFSDSYGGALMGMGGNDTLVGGRFDNYLDGGDGNDSLDGGAGSDSIFGGDGNDLLKGGDENHTAAMNDLAYAGNDSLSGDAGNDTIVAGNETLTGSFNTAVFYGFGWYGGASHVYGGGVDMSGGDGNDSLIGGDRTFVAGTSGFYGAGAVVYGGHTSAAGDAGNDTIVGGNDHLSAAASPVPGSLTVLHARSFYSTGGDGNDKITGVNTTIDGGNGFVHAYGGNGSFYGGDGNDAITAGSNLLRFGDAGGYGILNGTWDRPGDTIVGDSGNDTLAGGNNTFLGGAGDDFVYGSGDHISGDDGNDSIVGGNETLDGGAGDDSLLYFGENRSTIFDGGDGNDTIIGGTRLIRGGDGDDTLSGAVFHFSGGYGNDLITAGNQTVDGGAGDNLIEHNGYATLSGDDGNDTLNGANTDDSLWGGNGNDVLKGNAGNDVLNGESGKDNLDGGAGDDFLYGGAGDSLQGGAGDDTFYLDLSSGPVTVSDSAGDDTVILHYGGAAYTAGAGVEHVQSGGWTIALTGNALNNILTTGEGNDTLGGLGGNDILDAGGGVNRLEGGAGDDSYYIHNASDVVVEANGAGNDSIYSDVGMSGPLAANVENFFLAEMAGYGDILGNGGNNYLRGNQDGNYIDAGVGNDTLDGGGGNDDVLVGGTGNDTYIVYSGLAKVVEQAAGGTLDAVRSYASYQLSNNVENLTLLEHSAGTSFAYGAYGNSLGNVLNGNSLDNFIDGGADADTMAGGAGDDTYIVDSTGDKILGEAAGGGHDQMIVDPSANTSTPFVLATNVEDAALRGGFDLKLTGNVLDNQISGNSGNNSIDGGAGNDFIWGNAGNDTLLGGTGNDSLDGGSGADSMVGGAGNDTYTVDRGDGAGALTVDDVVVEAAGGGTADLVNSYVYSYVLPTQVENLTLQGFARNGTGNDLANVITGNNYANNLDGMGGNDLLYGGVGGDTLSGGAGNDSLDGGVGDDTLSGDAGNDTLDGGSGADNMLGGAGSDVYVVDDIGDVTDEGGDTSAGGGVDLVQTSVDFTLATGIERLTITADEGTIHVNGNDAANVMIGSRTNDSIDGMGGNDSLVGNDGNDTLVGTDGNDTMDGGSGDDWFVIDTAADKVVEAAGGGYDTVSMTSITTFSYTMAGGLDALVMATGGSLDLGEHSATGNELDNSMTGNLAGNVISGGGGNDYIAGSANPGVDHGAGDTLSGGTGDDSLLGGYGGDVLNGDDGNDSLAGGADADTLSGGAGDDTLDGGTGLDSMTGGAGDDMYYVDSGDGASTVIGATGEDTVVEAANAGTDTVIMTRSGSMPLYVLQDNVENFFANLGLAGDPLEFHGNGSDNLITLQTRFSGVDTIDGGGGDDTLVSGFDFPGLDSAYTVTTTSVEHMFLFADQGINTDWTLNTGNVDNQEVHLSGHLLSNSDVTFSDWGTGATLFLDGLDQTGGSLVTVQENNILDPLNVAMHGTNNVNLGFSGEGTPVNLSVSGESFDTTLNFAGVSGISTINVTGAAHGDLTLFGLAQNQTLAFANYAMTSTSLYLNDASGGSDSLSLVLDNADLGNVSFAGEGNVQELLSIDTGAASNGGSSLNIFFADPNLDITLTGAQDLLLTGITSNLDASGFNGHLTASWTGAGSFTAGNQDSTLFGDEGNQTFNFGEHLDHNDRIDADGGGDTLSADVSGLTDALHIWGVDTFNLTTNSTVPGGGAATLDMSDVTTAYISLLGDADFTLLNLNGEAGFTVDGSGLLGSAKVHVEAIGGNNWFSGAESDDTLIGAGGSDTLTGGAGNDTLDGGFDDQSDHFVFVADPGSGVDTILNFDAGTDVIELNQANFSAFVGSAPFNVDSANVFVAADDSDIANVDTWGDSDDFLKYVQSTGDLYYDADGVGAESALQIAHIDGHPTLQLSGGGHSDIVIVNLV